MFQTLRCPRRSNRDATSSPAGAKSMPISALLRDTSSQFPHNPHVTITRDGHAAAAPELPVDVQRTVDQRPIMNRQEYHERLAVAEALSRTSQMTSPAARRRLAARKVEMELCSGGGGLGGGDAYYEGYMDEEYDYVPPKQLLMYMVRMGSFNSAPKILNADTQDDELTIPPHGLSHHGLVQHCRLMRGEHQPALLSRAFLRPQRLLGDAVAQDVADGMRVLQLNSVSQACSGPVAAADQVPSTTMSAEEANHIRLFQWNILSQSLGQSNDGFVRCPDEALQWEHRKYLIIQEIVQTDPDIVCLQEVDHFKFLQSVLGTRDYEGIFYPKPDSPCLYISANNGPDGCAIFWKRSQYEMLAHSERVLEVWRVQSNQVAIAANFRVLGSGREFSVCTTHLKARSGALLSKLRNEQGKDLLRFASKIADRRPLLMCGDFNAEPTEPVYSTLVSNTQTPLSSAYADLIASKNMACSEAAAAASSHPSHSSHSSAAAAEDQTDDDASAASAAAAAPLSRAELLASQEPPFTTWKIREDGEVCHTIDYVFYTPQQLRVRNCLMFPAAAEIGADRTPSWRYPSDHFSLVCDFELLGGEEES